MWGHHPTREQLDLHLRDELPLPQRRRVARHVDNCQICLRRVQRLDEDISPGAARAGYEAAIQKAARGASSWLRRFEQESQPARHLLGELLQNPDSEILETIRSAPQELGLKLLRLVQERCRSAWLQEPARAVDLALLEIAVAERLDEARCGSGLVADSRALAWADLGNSYRILSDFRMADLALNEAIEYHRNSGDPSTESEVTGFQASLRRSQGRFKEAFVLFDRVIRIARESDDRHWEGKALIAKGTAIGDQAMGGRGDFQEALRLLRKGLARIDPSAAPDLALAAQHNLLFFVTESGRPEEAAKGLEQSRNLYEDLGNKSQQAKLRWLEGSIDASLGRLSAAAAGLNAVREMLSEQGLVLDSAFAALQLSLVHSRQGRLHDARVLLADAIPVFEAVGDEQVISAARLLAHRVRS